MLVTLIDFVLNDITTSLFGELLVNAIDVDALEPLKSKVEVDTVVRELCSTVHNHCTSTLHFHKKIF